MPFLDTSSRLGRLDYLTYCGGIALPISVSILSIPSLVMAYATPALVFHILDMLRDWLLIVLLFAECLLLVWTRRRLQDIGWNPNWSFLLAVVSLWMFIAIGRQTSAQTARLCTFGLFAVFASVPGTPVANRYGPPTPLKPTQVRNAIAVWVALSISWIGFPAGYLWHREHIRQERALRAEQLAVAAEAQWRDYFRSRKAWPDPRATPGRRFPIVRDAPNRDWYVISHWLSKDGRTFMVVDSVHHDGDMSLSSAPGAGAAVWTTDGGNSWHCGPYEWGHAEDFSTSCRDPGAPRAYSPFGWVI